MSATPPARPARRALAALPLRWKLTLLVAGILVGALIVSGVVLNIAVSRVLLDNTAQSLQSSARGAINERLNPRQGGPQGAGGNGGNGNGPRTGQPNGNPLNPQGQPNLPPLPPLNDLARLLTTRDTAARTVDPTGASVGDGPALAESSPHAAPLLDASAYRAVATSNQATYFRYATAEGPLLVVLMPLARDAGPGRGQVVGVLQLSTSLGSVDEFLARLRLLVALGTLAVVLLTVLVTVPLVRGVLRPLRRMAATSRAITAGDLSSRVDVPPGDDELADLARAFNQMVGRLDAAFATQRRFIADASHELRTPLTALGGGIEMLLLGADRADPAARSRLLHLMSGEIARMGRLVDDLLTLTRFDARPKDAVQHAPVELVALVARIADETRLLAPERIVALDAPEDRTITITGDADRLSQALLNLCANARVYTPPGGTITLGVRAAGGEAVVTVADTGAGIAPADLPRVWDRFYRADTARARQAGQGGLGLGLAIVRAVAEAHGGVATIASDPGAGTTVTLTFPDAAVTFLTPGPSPSPAGLRSS